MTEPITRENAFRAAIAAFIDARREAKLKGKEGGDDSVAKYDYATWLADAVARAHNLRVATHPIKFTHSSIKGATSIQFRSNHIPEIGEIGTHSLMAGYAEDFAVTDAKQLDVCSFLSVEFEGKRLLDWLRSGDKDFACALHHDADIAKAMMESFELVDRAAGSPVSNVLAKQVYWLHGSDASDDGHYHLVQPMFSSSLEHVVHSEVRSASSSAIAARGTKKQKPSYEDHSTFPGLVRRTIGGSNPQNVSPLNKARGGENYLFASLPPRWTHTRARSLRNSDDVWNQFKHFGEVRKVLKALVDLLRSEPDPTMETRRRREAIEQEFGQQLAIFASSVHSRFTPGWTRESSCDLHESEKLWLDPERTGLPPREGHEAEDAEFADAYERGEWPDEIAGRFANWLNARLRDAGIKEVGDSEAKHWARQAIVEADWPVPVQRRMPAGEVA